MSIVVPVIVERKVPPDLSSNTLDYESQGAQRGLTRI
jgi:hypothetical protein